MWFTAIAQLIGQEAATPQLDTRNPYASQQSNTTSLLVVGGVAVLLAGAAYFMLRTPPRALSRRSRR